MADQGVAAVLESDEQLSLVAERHPFSKGSSITLDPGHEYNGHIIVFDEAPDNKSLSADLESIEICVCGRRNYNNQHKRVSAVCDIRVRGYEAPVALGYLQACFTIETKGKVSVPFRHLRSHRVA